MPFLESKVLYQKVCEQAGINIPQTCQAGYFSRDMMSRLLIYLQTANGEIKKLRELIGSK